MNAEIQIRFRILHFIYHRGAAVQHWFGQRIRPAGVAALMALCFAAFMTIGQPKNSIFQIFCFTFGLVSIGFTWMLFRRAKLSAIHMIPNHATVGVPLHFSVILENTGKQKLRSARLVQIPPDPRPGLDEFSFLKEPGEDRRNIFDRTMAYYRWQWLMSRKSGFTARETDDSFDLAPLEKKRIPMSITPYRRGVIRMEGIRALLPDPLGFFQRCRPVPAPRSRLVVLPKRYRLPRIEMPGKSAYRIGGEETSNAIGSSGEFVGLREYRPGDPLRQIHWKSWAHMGKPMVKELEDTFYPRYGLVLDTLPGSPDEADFEEMVSVAASFVTALDHHESLLDLMFIAGEAHTVTAGRGMEKTGKLLEVLAGVSIGQQDDFTTLAKTVTLHRESMTSCLLVLNGWDAVRADFVKTLMEAGIVCVPLAIGRGSAPHGLIGHWLESGNIQRDLLRLPPSFSAAS